MTFPRQRLSAGVEPDIYQVSKLVAAGELTQTLTLNPYPIQWMSECVKKWSREAGKSDIDFQNLLDYL